jgi:hypothetical protein
MNNGKNECLLGYRITFCFFKFQQIASSEVKWSVDVLKNLKSKSFFWNFVTIFRVSHRTPKNWRVLDVFRQEMTRFEVIFSKKQVDSSRKTIF